MQLQITIEKNNCKRIQLKMTPSLIMISVKMQVWNWGYYSSWLQTWDSLKLFSPTEYSSLSGWGMPKSQNEYPAKDEFISYLKQYELR